MKLTNNQHIDLINAFILKHTDYQINEFTGGSVSNTLTHNNTQVHYKVNLYFGYKSNKPITKTIEIDEEIYSIMYKSISLKVKSLIAKEDKLGMDSIKDLIGLSSSRDSSRDSSTPTPRHTPTNTNYLPTTDTLPTNTIESDFDLFWSMYPKKQSKEAARKSFAKVYNELPLDTLQNILEANKRSEAWTKDNGKFVPMASTWLNNKRWTDEIQQSSSSQIDYLVENNIFDIIDEMEAQKTNQGIINE